MLSDSAYTGIAGTRTGNKKKEKCLRELGRDIWGLIALEQ